MFSSLLSLNYKDLVNGLVIAVISAVGGVLYQAAQAGSLDIFTYDWSSVGKLVLNATIIYLVKKLMTAENGKVFGKIG